MNYCNGEKDTASTFCNPCPYEGNCEECDRKLLLERLERLAIVLDELMPQCAELVRDALAILKEQEERINELMAENMELSRSNYSGNDGNLIL